MAIMLRRQLNDSEKEQVLKKYGRKCFATGHAIPEGEGIHFDHIRAFAEGGTTDINNIAPMCSMHNKAKGTLPLNDFRVKLRLDEFFSTGDSLTLKHLLDYFKKKGEIHAYGQDTTIQEEDGKVQIETASSTYNYVLHKCPTTGWKYFYATLPVTLLD